MLALIICAALYIGASTAETDEAVIKRLDATEDLVRALVTQVEHLTAQDKLQRKQITNLETKLRYQQQQNARFERLVKDLLSQTKPEYSVETTDLNPTSNNTTKDHSSHKVLREKSNRIRRAENETPVAFFAKMVNHLHHAGAHQPIVFETVVTNTGNAYYKHIGSFIAPVPGIYVMSTTLVAYNHVNAHAQFVKNGVALTTLYVPGSAAGYDTTSQTIVLNLQKGDVITVQNTDNDKSILGDSHSTFAGFLLQEDYSSSSIVGK